MKLHFLSLLFFFSLILASSTPASAFFVVNLTNYHQIELPKSVVGPESIAFDCRGKGPYVGVSDGRILKWQGPCRGWTEFAFTSPTRQAIFMTSLFSNINTRFFAIFFSLIHKMTFAYMTTLFKHLGFIYESPLAS